MEFPQREDVRITTGPEETELFSKRGLTFRDGWAASSSGSGGAAPPAAGAGGGAGAAGGDSTAAGGLEGQGQEQTTTPEYCYYSPTPSITVHTFASKRAMDFGEMSNKPAHLKPAGPFSDS